MKRWDDDDDGGGAAAAAATTTTTTTNNNNKNNNINNHTWDGVRIKNNAMGEKSMNWYHLTFEYRKRFVYTHPGHKAKQATPLPLVLLDSSTLKSMLASFELQYAGFVRCFAPVYPFSPFKLSKSITPLSCSTEDTVIILETNDVISLL